MVEQNFDRFERFWRGERHEYALFTVHSYGRRDYLIYHIPSKRVLLKESFTLTPSAIEKMIDMGVPVLDGSLRPAFRTTASPDASETEV
jgi:hypothetical protein